MKTKLHHQSIPAYLDVYNSLYTDIVTGIYPPGEHLPGETSLAEKYGVSRNTLRQALAILNEDGMIIKSQGKGTVIAPQIKQNTDEKIPNPMLALSRHTTLLQQTLPETNYFFLPAMLCLPAIVFLNLIQLSWVILLHKFQCFFLMN